jgi:hypothetical protein
LDVIVWVLVTALLPERVQANAMHPPLCVVDCVALSFCLMLELASTLAAANGATSNAKATANAENAMIDFVFIVISISTGGNINFVLTLKPKTTQNNLMYT